MLITYIDNAIWVFFFVKFSIRFYQAQEKLGLCIEAG